MTRDLGATGPPGSAGSPSSAGSIPSAAPVGSPGPRRRRRRVRSQVDAPPVPPAGTELPDPGEHHRDPTAPNTGPAGRHTGAAAPGATDDAGPVERSLLGLIGGGSSQVNPVLAMRARDAARPRASDLDRAEAEITIVRRYWTPRDDDSPPGPGTGPARSRDGTRPVT